MIVNGFCKEVFRELPMEFAVEAQKLLGVSLEGVSGRKRIQKAEGRMLEIKNLHASIGDREILRGIDLTINAGEVHAIMARTVQGRAHWRAYWPAGKTTS